MRCRCLFDHHLSWLSTMNEHIWAEADSGTIVGIKATIFSSYDYVQVDCGGDWRLYLRGLCEVKNIVLI